MSLALKYHYSNGEIKAWLNHLSKVVSPILVKDKGKMGDNLVSNSMIFFLYHTAFYIWSEIPSLNGSPVQWLIGSGCFHLLGEVINIMTEE